MLNEKGSYPFPLLGFTAPYVTATTVLTFRLTVTDNSGGTASDTVVITVNPGDITPPVLTGSYVMRKSKGATYYDVTLAANEPATFSYGVRGADGRPTGVISNPSSTAQTATFTVQRTEAGDLTVFYSALDTAGNSASSTLLL